MHSRLEAHDKSLKEGVLYLKVLRDVAGGCTDLNGYLGKEAARSGRKYTARNAIGNVIRGGMTSGEYIDAEGEPEE